MLDRGTGADRQLKVYADTGGDFRRVVEYMVQETEAGL
jgi:glutamate---cysteine ligase / carboxylate-amine ligase